MDLSDIGPSIVQGILAFAMIASGGMKATTPREKLIARMAWGAGFPTWAPVAIGAAEVAGGIGMVLPWASGSLPAPTPVAGACLAILMVGAVKVHADLADLKGGMPAGVLGLLGIFVAIGRAI